MKSSRLPNFLALSIWLMVAFQLGRAYIEPSRKNFFLKIILSSIIAFAVVLRRLRGIARPLPAEDDPDQERSRGS